MNRVLTVRLLPVLTVLLLLGAVCGAHAQEPNPAPAKDTIFARKILMGSIDMNMDEIETALAGGSKVHLGDLREHAENISIMLLAFPQLFPVSTNQWRPDAKRDPATDTFASPDLWTRFADFYAKAAAASKTAQFAGRAPNEEDFRKFATELRGECNACHAAYQKRD